MNIQSNVKTITEQTQLFQNIALVLLIVCIAFVIASVVFFIVFKIPHSFRVLTGMGMNKEMSKSAKASSDRKRATLSWGASDSLSKMHKDSFNVSEAFKQNEAFEETTILEDEQTILLSDFDATTLLNDETTLLGSEETTLLGSEETVLLSDLDPIFEMEDDIKITVRNING